jgi:DNA-3-methyladenine glycosylase I
MVERKRCWGQSPLMIDYHDQEWGAPLHDDARLFEFFVLSGTQAGLSWEIVFKKRAAYRKAFHGFDVDRVARYTARDVARLLNDPGIVRNRQKIEAAIHNARCVRSVREEHGTFDKYLWSFVEGRPVCKGRRTIRGLPAQTPLSDRVSEDLRARGFKFAGSTIVYAFLQTVGIVNDHLVSCFRYAELPR